MEISIDTVDWATVTDMVSKGTLADELFDIEGGENWIAPSTKWSNESFSTYCSMAAAFETQLPSLDEQTRTSCNNSLFLVLNETADMPKELGEALDTEYYVGNLSPKTVTNILANYNEINQDSFSTFIPTEIMNYINEWVQTLKEAESLKRGIVVHVG